MDRDQRHELKEKATTASQFYHELSNETTLNPSNDVNRKTCFSNQPQQHHHHHQRDQQQQQHQQLVFHLIASDELETVETTVSEFNLNELNQLIVNADNNSSNDQPAVVAQIMKSEQQQQQQRRPVTATSERVSERSGIMRKRDNIIFAASNEMTVRERGGVVCFDGDRVKNNVSDKTVNFSLLSAQIRSQPLRSDNVKQPIDRNFSRNYENLEAVVGRSETSGTPFPSVENLIKMYASLVNDQSLVKAKPKVRPAPKADQEVVNESEVIQVSELDCIKQFDQQMQEGQVRPTAGSASDEGFSGDEESEYKSAEKVTRSSSSDSALGADEEVGVQPTPPIPAKRRATLTVNDIPLRPALLPVALPSSLPSGDCLVSPISSDGNSPTIVRSRILLEEQLIEISNIETDDFDTAAVTSLPPTATTNYPSRRESTVSDFDGVVRYVRTPSVVLSDYCDEMLGGITLEDIEYLRRHRLNRKKSEPENDSDCSATSSCSNLNYCGSTISALDMDYQYEFTDEPQRKVSSCSTCSLVTCDEDDDPLPSEPIRPKRKACNLQKCKKCQKFPNNILKK